MKLRLALIALIATPAIAQAQAVQYRAADNLNNIPVSAATPLPVTPGAGAAGSSSATPAFEARQSGTTTRTSGTITTANTFQSVLAANTARKDCQITNTSANAMTVDVGAAPAAATARPLPSGATFACSTTNVVITDQINLTSPTAGSTFVVWAQ